MVKAEREIGENRLIGLIGHPVSHSVGQIFFNRLFQKLNLQCSYIAMDIHPSVLEYILRSSSHLFSGFNVTIPHKVSVLGITDSLDESARDSHNANLIRIERKKMVSYNTDFKAILHLLSDHMVEDAKPLVFGTGGTARTVVSALLKTFSPEKIYIASRDPQRASGELQPLWKGSVEVIGYEEVRKLRMVNIISNCTPVGMQGSDYMLPLPRSIQMDPLVIDMVYTPPDTPLATWAKKHSENVITGDMIYLEQAARTLELLCQDKDVSRSIMRDVFAESMAEAGYELSSSTL